MYDNIGGKIKGLAIGTFIVEAIASIITGIVLLISDDDTVLFGFITILLGPIVAWISSWLLYGFGQLIENSDIIAQEHHRINQKHEIEVVKQMKKGQKQTITQNKLKVKEIVQDNELSDDKFIDITCPNCNEKLSFPKKQLMNADSLQCPMCDEYFNIR